MKTENTSLFKMTPKSLTDEQTKTVFSKFISIAKELGIDKLQGVELVPNKDKTRIMYKYIQKSKMYDNAPSFSIDVVTSCQGLEKVQMVRAFLNNCGLCQGQGSADITQRKFKQIDNVLENAFDLFKTTYEEYLAEDLKQAKFDKVVDAVKSALKSHDIRKKEDGNYTTTVHMLGKHKGEIHTNRSNQTFSIEIDGLSAEESKQIGEVVSSL